MDNEKTFIDELRLKFYQKYKGNEVKIFLVRENPSNKYPQMRCTEDIYDLVKEEMLSIDREIFLSVLLNARKDVIGIELISVGALNSFSVSLREVFKSAILANADSIVCCHNHVSGNDSEPSKSELYMTGKIIQAGDLLGIPVLDHLIISTRGFKSIIDINKSYDELVGIK